MPYTYLREELGICLTRAGLKIPAEGIGYQPHDGGYLLEVYLLREVAERIIIDSIDPLTLLFGKIMAEPYGRQQMRVGGNGKGGKTFYQSNDPSHSFRMTDLLDKGRNVRMFAGVDLQSPAGFIQQAADRLYLRQLQKSLTPEILRKMDHRGMNFAFHIFVEVNIVISPVMRQIGAYKDNIARIESLDVIPHELRTTAFVKINELDLGMIVPAIVDIRVPVFTYAERMRRSLGNF